MDDIGLGYKLRTAATFRGILNDLKRNDEVAAEELGVDTQLLRRHPFGEVRLAPRLDPQGRGDLAGQRTRFLSDPR